MCLQLHASKYMKLVFTKSNLPLSVAIRLVTGEPVSHFAFVFESAAKGLMFEANLLGTHPKFWATAQKDMTVVFEKDVPLSIEIEDQLWDIVVQQYDDHGYDYLGAIYLGYRKLLNRIFKIPIPATNAWAEAGHFFCDEVCGVFNQTPGFPKINVASGMDTPYDVWLKIKDWNYTP